MAKPFLPSLVMENLCVSIVWTGGRGGGCNVRLRFHRRLQKRLGRIMPKGHKKHSNASVFAQNSADTAISNIRYVCDLAHFYSMDIQYHTVRDVQKIPPTLRHLCVSSFNTATYNLPQNGSYSNDRGDTL